MINLFSRKRRATSQGPNHSPSKLGKKLTSLADVWFDRRKYSRENEFGMAQYILARIHLNSDAIRQTAQSWLRHGPIMAQLRINKNKLWFMITDVDTDVDKNKSQNLFFLC